MIPGKYIGNKMFYVKYVRIYLSAWRLLGPLWSCSYESWIYDYMCSHDEVFSIQHYVKMLGSDLRQVGGFVRVHRFPQLQYCCLKRALSTIIVTVFCLYVLTSVWCCPLWFPHKQCLVSLYPHFLMECARLIYVICVQHILCFLLFCLSLSCVLCTNVASFSGLFILDLL